MSLRAFVVIALGLVSTTASALNFTSYEDDFYDWTRSAARTIDWSGGNGWGTQAPSPHNVWYEGNTAGDISSFNSKFILGQTWNLGTKVSFKNYYQNNSTAATASVGFSASTTNPSNRVLVTVNRIKTSPGYILVQVAWFDGSAWHEVLNSGWISGAPADFVLQVQRAPNALDKLYIAIANNGVSAYSGWTASMGTGFLDALKIPGYRVYNSDIWFADLSIQTPMPVWSATQRIYHDKAREAIGDMLQNWWSGDFKNGHILPTGNDGRYPPSIPPEGNDDPRGGLWHRATLMFAVEGLYKMDADINLHELLKAQWYYDKDRYRDEWETCGDGTISPAMDDAAWKLMYLAVALELTGDTDARDHGLNLAWNIFKRWGDAKWGGGLYYNDYRTEKSIYGATYASAALLLYQQSGIEDFWSLGTGEHLWIHNHLYRVPNALACDHVTRGDGIYWSGYGSEYIYGTKPPQYTGDCTDAESDVGFIAGQDCDCRPNAIATHLGVSFFGMVAGMSANHAIVGKLTGDPSYTALAVATANAIGTSLLGSSGLFVDDRDAWTNGTLLSLWARNVLAGNGGQPLPGVSADVVTKLRATADSIYDNRRLNTTGLCGILDQDCYSERFPQPMLAHTFGGDWDGGHVWYDNGVTPNQIMTSASAVSVIVAAAYLQ